MHEYFLNELFLITDMERRRNGVEESLKEISTVAVLRNLTDISHVDSGDSERNTGYSDRRMDQKEEKNTKASKEVSDEKGFNSIYGGETAGI